MRDSTAGVTTTWTYDGEDILRENSGATTLKYVQGSEIDEPIAQEDGSGVLGYFHADGLDSIVKTTDAAGAVTGSRRYDTFGNSELGAMNGFAFTGREFDTETGLAYFRARYYDPRLGRFLSEDPIHFSSDDLNFYVYVHSDPVNWTDPSGLLGKGHSSGTVITGWGPVPRSGQRRSPRGPDFTVFSCQLFFVQFGWAWIPGNPHAPPVVSGGFGGPKGCGCTLMGYVLAQRGTPPEPQVRNFMTKRSYAETVALGMGVSIAWSPGNGTALGAGLGFSTPGLGGTYGAECQACKR